LLVLGSRTAPAPSGLGLSRPETCHLWRSPPGSAQSRPSSPPTTIDGHKHDTCWTNLTRQDAERVPVSVHGRCVLPGEYGKNLGYCRSQPGGEPATARLRSPEESS
jgi:hypothetical protein